MKEEERQWGNENTRMKGAKQEHDEKVAKVTERFQE